MEGGDDDVFVDIGGDVVENFPAAVVFDACPCWKNKY